jgi:glycosyltransferase involved in cell wall biosynthesis
VKKKRLTFVIAHLGAGGAQRVATNAANALVERGYDVHVVVLYQRPEAYRIDPRVVIHSESPRQSLGFDFDQEPADEEPAQAKPSRPLKPAGQVERLKASIKRSPRLYNFTLRVMGPAFAAYHLTRITILLRRRIREIKPDAVLSFLTQTNIATVLATRGLDTHTVISERNDPRRQRQRFRVEFLRRVCYRWADVVTANSKGALVPLEAFVPRQKLAFLPNPLAAAPSSEVAVVTAPTVITVGRLVEQKGIDVLLDAWAKVAAVLPDWRLALVGDGPLTGELKERARNLGIADSVDWVGHVSDPFPYLRGAKLFVMTSRFEGTPNALLEAMACGLPAVVSDASPGPCELIGEGDDAAGLIVPVEDADATAEAIIRLARDETVRRRLALAAQERASLHDADRAIDVWLKLLGCG